ncbi:hypothetical protein [Streptomyces sp. 1-11]|uniref:hypothetical protein n=1 Tax=Streptomyces sp. 1-11 TaxID=2590549 RepID=UPI00116EC29D|nr:hypothetical protein [Streptomyces sp. 1-11]GEK00073.1 hypothetical protein TNCT1_23490 [Streptomyces sp. 1-11]
MDATVILLFILAIAGVVSRSLSSVKRLLDEVPEVLDSATEARDAWRRFRRPELPPPADDQQKPPAAV